MSRPIRAIYDGTPASPWRPATSRMEAMVSRGVADDDQKLRLVVSVGQSGEMNGQLRGTMVRAGRCVSNDARRKASTVAFA
jgi:hypothetical protein